MRKTDYIELDTIRNNSRTKFAEMTETFSIIRDIANSLEWSGSAREHFNRVFDDFVRRFTEEREKFDQYLSTNIDNWIQQEHENEQAVEGQVNSITE